eukprot:GHVT01015389.1.p1 GENE.GHVT01015389.1~~GHVT01015389.1.p1  ORF type:complete len:1210 (+),score=158.02 GHVT01015389.1:631-4260(+)
MVFYAASKLLPHQVCHRVPPSSAVHVQPAHSSSPPTATAHSIRDSKCSRNGRAPVVIPQLVSPPLTLPILFRSSASSQQASPVLLSSLLVATPIDSTALPMAPVGSAPTGARPFLPVAAAEHMSPLASAAQAASGALRPASRNSSHAASCEEPRCTHKASRPRRRAGLTPLCWPSLLCMSSVLLCLVAICLTSSPLDSTARAATINNIGSSISDWWKGPQAAGAPPATTITFTSPSGTKTAAIAGVKNRLASFGAAAEPVPAATKDSAFFSQTSAAYWLNGGGRYPGSIVPEVPVPVPPFTQGGSEDDYDIIIVGAGCVGAPLAGTLAKGGLKVLVVERGPERSWGATPAAMDIYGAGRAIHDPTISQLVKTTQGVRTHIGSVTGGGTAINIAISIEETDEYFDLLEQKTGVTLDRDLIQDSFSWVGNRTASNMPHVSPYGNAWADGLQSNGFESAAEDPTALPPHSMRLERGYVWGGNSLFNASRGFLRQASDVMMSDAGAEDLTARPANLILRAEQVVTRVLFDEEAGGPPVAPGAEPTAYCIEYRDVMASDTADIGMSDEEVADLEAERDEAAQQYTSQDYLTQHLLEKGSWSKWMADFITPSPATMSSLLSLFQMPTKTRVQSLKTTPPTKRACVRTGGQVILSAGAIQSTLLMYKSGVGPREQVVGELGLEMKKEIPSLGQEFGDRVLIPVVAFFEKEPEDIPHELRDRYSPVVSESYPPRICQFIGAKPTGPQCDNFGIYDKTLQCTMQTAEEISGAQITEYVVYATRVLFPPHWRGDPLVDFIVQAVQDCSEGRAPFGNILLSSVCVFAAPIHSCFRRIVSNFYFTSEPKSKGHIKLKRDGRVEVNANYMKDDQDLFDAVRGVSSLVKLLEGDTYKGVLQKKSPTACPMTILNGILDMMLHVGLDDKALADHGESLDKLQHHLEDLMPVEYRRRRRLLDSDGVTVRDIQSADLEKLPTHVYHRVRRLVAQGEQPQHPVPANVEAVEEKEQSAARRLAGATSGSGRFAALAAAAAKTRESLSPECQAPCAEGQVCAKDDVFCKVCDNPKRPGFCDGMLDGNSKFSSMSRQSVVAAGEYIAELAAKQQDHLTGESIDWIFNDVTKQEENQEPVASAHMSPFFLADDSKGWAATYPPTMPGKILREHFGNAENHKNAWPYAVHTLNERGCKHWQILFSVGTTTMHLCAAYFANCHWKRFDFWVSV